MLATSAMGIVLFVDAACEAITAVRRMQKSRRNQDAIKCTLLPHAYPVFFRDCPTVITLAGSHFQQSVAAVPQQLYLKDSNA
jgi:hypothetical protein